MTKTCATKWIEKMNDTTHCVGYMSKVMPLDTSVDQLDNVCAHIKGNFTIADSLKLCTHLGDAHSKFWHEFYKR
jgi:hypothetical protein